MLHIKVFRSTDCPWPHHQHRYVVRPRHSRRRPSGRNRRRHPEDHSGAVLWPSLPRPAGSGARQGASTSASRLLVVLASRSAYCREAPLRLITAEYEELAGRLRRNRSDDARMTVHDVLNPAGTFPDLKHLVGTQRHQYCARLSTCAAAISSRRAARPHMSRARRSRPSR